MNGSPHSTLTYTRMVTSPSCANNLLPC